MGVILQVMCAQFTSIQISKCTEGGCLLAIVKTVSRAAEFLQRFLSHGIFVFVSFIIFKISQSTMINIIGRNTLKFY